MILIQIVDTASSGKRGGEAMDDLTTWLNLFINAGSLVFAALAYFHNKDKK